MQTQIPILDFNGGSPENLYDTTDPQVIASYQYGLCVTATQRSGTKHYELSNHLGNVLAVISDHKLAVDDMPITSLIITSQMW